MELHTFLWHSCCFLSSQNYLCCCFFFHTFYPLSCCFLSSHNYWHVVLNSCLSGDNCQSSTALISPFPFGRKKQACFLQLSFSFSSFSSCWAGIWKRYRILLFLKTIALVLTEYPVLTATWNRARTCYIRLMWVYLWGIEEAGWVFLS